MPLSRWIQAAGIVCAFSGVARADFNPAVAPRVASVAALTSGHYSQYRQLYLSAYGNGASAVSDGGDGMLIQVSSCTNDNGSCFHDADGTAFQRNNINGDLRQYGITLGSVYDCSLSTGSGVNLCSDAAPVVKNALAAAVTDSINTVTGNGVQFKLTTDGNGGSDPFTIDGNVCLDNATDFGEMGITDPSDVPGIVWLGDVTTLELSNGGCFQYGALVNAWFGINYPHGTANIADNYAVANHMVSAGKTGITCSGGGCSIHHAGAFGFDTSIDARGPHLDIDHIDLDADVGVYVHDVGTNLTIDGFTHRGDITGGSDGTEYFSVANVTDNGSGVCRVQFRALSGGDPLSDIQDGMMMWVSGLDSAHGGINAWGRWNVAKISSDTFDLPGSVCNGSTLAGPSFTANTTAGSFYLTNVSSFANIRGDFALSGSGISGGTTIQALWANKSTIVMSAKATATATGVTVATAGGTFVFPNPDECDGSDGGAQNPCGVLSAVLRPLAGNSAGGVAAGNVGTGIMCGGTVPEGGGLTDVKVATLKLNNATMYGIGIAFNFNNCVKVSINNFSYDSIRKVKDDLTAFCNITGKTQNVTFNASGAGKIGFGCTVNAEDTDILHKAQILANATNLQDIELDGGALVMTGGNLDNAFVANAAKGFSVRGYNGNLKVYYEGAAAQAVSDTSGTSATAGAAWWGGHFEPGGPVPISLTAGTGAAFAIGSNDTSGSISIGSGNPTDIGFSFAAAWQNSPSCHAQDLSNTLVSITALTVSTTAVAFVASLPMGIGDVVQFTCTGASE